MKLQYEIPHGLSEEVRWFKFFSMRSLVVLVCSSAPGVLLVRVFGSFGATVPFLIFWFFLVAVLTGSTMLKIPSSRWMNGGGEYIDRVLMRRFIRYKKRCLYIKGYNQLVYEQEEGER